MQHSVRRHGASTRRRRRQTGRRAHACVPPHVLAPLTENSFMAATTAGPTGGCRAPPEQRDVASSLWFEAGWHWLPGACQAGSGDQGGVAVNSTSWLGAAAAAAAAREVAWHVTGFLGQLTGVRPESPTLVLVRSIGGSCNAFALLPLDQPVQLGCSAEAEAAQGNGREGSGACAMRARSKAHGHTVGLSRQEKPRRDRARAIRIRVRRAPASAPTVWAKLGNARPPRRPTDGSIDRSYWGANPHMLPLSSAFCQHQQ